MKLSPVIAALLCAAFAAAAPDVRAQAQSPLAAVQAPAPLSDAETAVLAAALGRAGEQGLARPGDAALLASLAGPARESARAALRLRMIDYGRELRTGRVDPIKVDKRWTVRQPPYDAAAGFEAARASGLSAWLADLAPQTLTYRVLVAIRPRYQALAAQGGWTPLPAKSTPEQLRARLQAEGYLPTAAAAAATAAPAPAGPAPAELDPVLTQALAEFQAHHGLKPDGALGAATRRALNVSVQARLAQIDVNLERQRWLPRIPSDRRIEVDAGQQMAVLFAGGKPVLTMRVIVGAASEKRQTPLFASAIQTIVLNPPWNVPADIAALEILPHAASDPTYMARRHYSYVGGRVVQAPGDDNALGHIKFDFPSPFGVYLHDTNSRSLFAQDKRTLSHGCMRLEKPRELAQALLAGQGMTLEMIDAAIAEKSTRTITIAEPLPLQVTYTTITVAADGGSISFLDDPYGWDAKLAAAMAQTAAR